MMPNLRKAVILVLSTIIFPNINGFVTPPLNPSTSLSKSSPISKTKQTPFGLQNRMLKYPVKSDLSLSPEFHDFLQLFTGTTNDILSSMPTQNVAISETAREAIEMSALNNLGHDIFTFLIASVAIVPLSRALNITPVLGFLAVGCAIGPHGLGLFSNNEADIQLGDFGILFLLFNEGLSLTPERIKQLGSFSSLGLSQLLLSIVVFFAGTLVGGDLILRVVEQIGVPLDDNILRPIMSSPAQAFTIAAAGALSSSAFVLPVLKQKKWENRPEGIAGLAILLLQDLAVAPLLVILPLIAGSGPQTTAELGVLVAKATVGFGAVLVAGSYFLRYVFDVVAAARSTETFVAAALLVALGMGQTADFLGLSATTGAFAAGVLLAGNKFRAQIQADIKPFEGILLGVFFMTAGAGLDPKVVLNEWPTLLTGIAAFIVTKAGIIVAQGPLLGLTFGESARVGLTLAGGGEFAFVIFKLAQDLGVLPKSLAELLSASVIISMSLTPLLGDLGEQAGMYIERKFGGVIHMADRDDLSSAEVESIFDQIDTNGSGTIEIEELRVPLLKKGFHYNSIAEIFAAFDYKKDGTICKEEWKSGVDCGIIATALSIPLVEEDCSEGAFKSDAYVICGYGEMGKSVYKMLLNAGVGKGRVVALDLNPSRVTAGVLTGEPVIFGDGAKFDLFKAAGVKTPKAVVITYASDARRLEATTRLKEALPQGTPIFATSACNRVSKELLDAGATEVISETTEVVLRFGSLLGACDSLEGLDTLRKKSFVDLDEEEIEPVPGFSESALSELAEEVGCTRSDLSRLYSTFSALDANDDGDVPIPELRDMVLLNVSDGPVDGQELERCMEKADADGDGDLTFEEFVRVSCVPPL